jgi:hypothetical protein
MSDSQKYRSSTTEPHALFEGRMDLYWADRAWRWDIPRAGADDPAPKTEDDE